MKTQAVLKHLGTIIYVIILIGTFALLRIVPHPPNVAPITGIALLSGAKLFGLSRFALPLSVMLVSDIFLGFHDTIVFVYGSFILITLMGSLFLRKKDSFLNIAGTALLSSLLFYLVTNFGVWFSTDMYPKTLDGLIQSYIMGLPFFKNTIIGDCLYAFGVFYAYKASLRFVTYNWKAL
jgi:hypothetical protein